MIGRRRSAGVRLAALMLAAGAAAAADTAAAWRQAIGGKILGRPLAQAESVVVVSEDRSLRSYGRSGAFLWRFEAGGRIGPHLSRSPEGTSYFSRTDGSFIAVNRSGRELWRTKLDAPLASPALVGYDGRVFAATERALSCYSAAGLLKWRRRLEAKPAAPAAMDSAGGVVLGLSDGTVLRATAFGAVSAFSVSSAPSAVADYAAEGGPRIVAALEDGRIVAEDPETGGARLIAAFSSPAAALAVRGGKLGALLREGTVALLDLADARILWTGQAPLSREWSLRYDERGLYALGDGGAAGFAEDGRRLWNLRIAGAAAPPALSDEGMLYSGGNDWILYAYKVEDRVRTRADSPYAPRAEGSYGLGGAGPSEAAEEPANPFAREEAFIASVLQRAEASIASGDVGEREPELTALLRDAAGSERSPVRRRLPAVLPHFRARAAELLGKLGSRELLPFLADLFHRDPESVVRAAAAEAVGLIGSDPDGSAMEAFENAIQPPYPARDERLLIAVASSIGALCRFSGPPLSERGIRVLVSLSSADRPAVVRNRARSELESLTARDFAGK